ncbi:DUF2975 domain-containing protein [Streptomyces sp. NPDC048604]|uniref:DUF2975 domain-containing protein n=1 Tax=Streptomyces sp. NPDC048604 TaxID=3365578 RepID=UPI00371C88B0
MNPRWRPSDTRHVQQPGGLARPGGEQHVRRSVSSPLRVIVVLGMVAAQVALVCVWRLVTMVRRGTVFSHAAFRYVDGVIGAIVAAALLWFTVTALNAPGQRDDPGVTVIMGGVGLGILGVALIVLVLRMLLAQAVARDVEAAQM